MRGGGSGPTAATAGAWMKRLLGLSASIRNALLGLLVVLVLVGGVVLTSSLILRLSDAFYLTPLRDR